MCRRRTVTTALVRGRESQSEGQSEGGEGWELQGVVGDERRERNVRGCCVRVRVKGPQELLLKDAASLLEFPKGCSHQSSTGWWVAREQGKKTLRGMTAMKGQRHAA